LFESWEKENWNKKKVDGEPRIGTDPHDLF
jgi:hypothetical protein